MQFCLFCENPALQIKNLQLKKSSSQGRIREVGLAHALANPSEIDAALRDEEDAAARLSAANRAA